MRRRRSNGREITELPKREHREGHSSQIYSSKSINNGPKRNPLRGPQQVKVNKTGGKMLIQPPIQK